MNWMRRLLILEVVLILLLGPLAVCDPENQSAQQAQSSAPGRLMRLSDGVTHFEFSKPRGAAAEARPVVVLVPGLATPYFIWDRTRADLLAAGFRVLRYDIYGRGFSDRPRGVAHDVDLYDRQLLELLNGLRIREPAHVVGLSMGGVISIHFADRHPERTRSLSLIAPAGFPLEIPLIARFARLPLVGDYFIHAFGHRQFVNRLDRNMYDQSLLEQYRTAFLPQMYVTGTKAALLSSLRNMPLGTSRPVYERVAAKGLPLQIFWGEHDQVIPYAVGQAMHAALPDVPFTTVPAAGHILHWEKPEAIRAKLLYFLKDH